MPSLRVAIVGGGYAGLAAAERLVRRGAMPTVFERSGHLGGLAMTVSVGGDEVEKYYHHWFTSDRDVLGLVHDLDLADRLRWISPVMGIFCRGEIHRFTSPIDLLRFKPFSWRAKLRFGAVTLFLQRYPRRQTFEGVSAASWLRRVAGREVYETVWGPLLRAKFGRRAEDVSMAWIWSKMRLRGRSRTQDGTEEALGYLQGGFGVLTRRLAAEIERRGGVVRTAEAVEEVAPAPDGGFVLRTPRGAERFEAVISTVAPPILARLAPALPADYRQRLARIDHHAILCTLLVLRRRISPIYWMNVSDPEVPFGGLIEHTNFISPERYGGRRLAYVSHYVDPEEDDVWRLEREPLLRRYEPGLRRIQPHFARDWIEDAHPFRDRYAQPIVTTDYHRRLLPLESPIRGLFVATMAQVYPEDRGTNYAVRIGRAVADRLLDDRGSGALPPPELRATPVGRPDGAEHR